MKNPTIRSLFEKDIDRHIQGVIKADDESDLLNEVSEYVVTTEVSKRLDDLLSSYLQEKTANGVWISGFFGSGKSHLLKMLSLLLPDRELDGRKVSEIFHEKLKDDPMLAGDLKKALKIPSQSVLFNIDQKADVIAKNQTDALLSVFVKVFNEVRGYYGMQGYIAEIEAELDARGQFEAFKEAFAKQSKGIPWSTGRDTVHALDNEVFARAFSQVSGVSYEEALKVLDRKQASYKVSIESFAEEINKWIAKQQPNFRLNFFVDEVGQFIGTDSKLMLNLQTIVETLATKCKGRAWVFVTSQGDLSAVLGELGENQGTDITKIQGRFIQPLNLTSQDVAEVICRRLLAKQETGALHALFESEKENLRTLFKFGDKSRDYNQEFQGADHFADFYPFHPYQFELLQASLIELSRHNFFTGKFKSIGERSMLGILQDVVKSLGDEPVGRFATFDAMFDGIRSSLRADLQTSVLTAERLLGEGSMETRVIKALFLLKFVKEFKSTPRNIAILLIDRCDIDIAAHEKAVRTALNKLEHDTYIQRSGDIFEFLTDDEKDVEAEIKGTEVDDSDVRELLVEIVFDHIIGEAKFRFEDNKQDYFFTRRLDGQVFRKREFDMGIHIATPLHESADRPADMVAQSLGKAELLLILPPDARLLDDLKLHRKTEKYCQQNLSSNMPAARYAILTAKRHANTERRNSLQDRLKEALLTGKLYLNGSELAHASTDPKSRMAKAFQDLVRYAFPSLRMLKKAFVESDLKDILTTPADDFFKHDDGTLGEAEKEILLKLQVARSAGTRIHVADLLTAFEKRPYGWPQIATQCLVARLYMRGKVELRSGANLLSGKEAMDALSNNRLFSGTVVTLQEQFDSATVSKLKKFHQEFFNSPNPANEAKEVAIAFQDSLRTEAAELEKLASHASAYPFLADLSPVAKELSALAHREWSHCLKEVASFSDRLLDLKEATIDPLKAFYNGSKRTIFDEISGFLRDEAPNFVDLPADDIAPLRTAVDSPTVYKGNTLQQANAKLTSVREAVAKLVTEAREEATGRLAKARESFVSSPEFTALDSDKRADLLEPFDAATTRLKTERLAPVVREAAERAATELLPSQLQKASNLILREGGDDEDPTPEYVTARKIHVPFEKTVLENEEDLAAYLDAMRETYSTTLRNNKRITL
jgi:hypothetical protein